MARPKKEVDPEMIEKLATVGCTIEQIAAVLGVSKDLLHRRFNTALRSGREKGNAALHKKQYQVAMSGNVGMLVWLGKQRLGQTDKVEQRVEEVKAQIVFETEWGRSIDVTPIPPEIGLNHDPAANAEALPASRDAAKDSPIES
jgi:AraC-like DNA-binding protein